MNSETLYGLVTEVERYAIHDGEGIRTTVFLKGCPLRCRWCCNPETQVLESELGFFADRCSGCGACAAACAEIARDDVGRPVLPRAVCAKTCGGTSVCACTRACVYSALRQMGERKSVAELLGQLKRDIQLYDSTGGGVTLSGGEPMCQPDFTAGILEGCRALYIDTAMETCAAGKLDDYACVMPYLNTIFVDLKSMDAWKFLEWAHYPLEKLLHNIEEISGLAKQNGTRFFLRVPIIPGFNADPEDARAMAAFAAALPQLDGVELLPYHKLGRGKYPVIGREYLLSDLEPPDEQCMDLLRAEFIARGIMLVQF